MRNIFLFLFFFILWQSELATADTIIPPVVVTTKKTSSHTLTSGDKTIITQQDLTETGAASLSQALQELGGVQLQDTTGNGSQVLLSLRGFGVNASSNTLLLVNGIPITNPDLMPPDLNAIPIQDIEFIEIIGGSESVQYGDQAVGGVINLITRNQSLEKGSFSCAAGSYNDRNCYGSFNKKIRKLNLGLNALASHTNNYRVHNDYDQKHLTGVASYPYASGNLQFNYQIANENMQYPGALTAAQVSQNRRQANNSTDFFRDWNGFYHLKDQQKLGSNWQLNTDLVRREMHGDGVLTQSFRQSRTIYFFNPQLKGTIGKSLLMSGIDYESDQYHLASLFGVTKDNEQKYGLFTLINYPLNNQVELSIGARGAQQNNQLVSFQSNNRINRAFAGTVGGTFQLRPHTQFYLRRAENFRFPKADENASTAIGVNGLKTQRGVSYETGINWIWKNLTNKIGIFQLNLRDEITFDPIQTVQQPFGANRNLAPTLRRGGSLTESLRLTDRLALGAQYNYVNARFQSGPNAGNRIPIVSENLFHASVNYQLTEHWNLFTETIYTGNQYPANDDANLSRKIGGYTTYNCNLRYHFKQFSASFRVNNIFNKYYYFYSVLQPGMPQEFFYPAPGRNLLLTLKYVFI